MLKRIFRSLTFAFLLCYNVGFSQWIQTNGPYGGYIISLAVSGTNLFAGSWGSGVWRRPLPDFVTSVEMLSTDLPTHFSLDQNYPNPFNPSTTIKFELPRMSHVSLCVYNTLGQLINLLIDESKPAGVFSAQFDAASLPSGVYFYRLQAGEFTQTKKLVLVR